MLRIKHVEIEAASIFALLINHAVHLLFVQLETIKHLAHVHQDLKEIRTGNVTKVRAKSIFLDKNSFLGFKLVFMQNNHHSRFLQFTIYCVLVKKGECQHDSECRDNTACIENQCLDPCKLTEPCGKNAQCTTSAHRPVCRCPSNWAGNPHEECYQCRF